MHDLSIRKVPGIGRVNERLLEAIGIKASRKLGSGIYSLTNFNIRRAAISMHRGLSFH